MSDGGSKATEMESVNALSKALEKMFMKNVPTWDISERGQSIKTHIRRFENAVGGIDEMNEEEKAREFIATLRGQASTFVEGLDQSIRSNYTDLKKELISIFHKEKSVSVLMKEFNQLKWIKNRQSLREFASVLKMQWRKIALATDEDYKTNDKTEQAILKTRLLEAIKDSDSNFGSQLEFFLTDHSMAFKDLASLADIKWDLYKENNERMAEAEYDNDAMFVTVEDSMRKQEHIRPNSTRSPPTRSPRYKINRRQQAENFYGYWQNNRGMYDKADWGMYDSADWCRDDVSTAGYYQSSEEPNYSYEQAHEDSDELLVDHKGTQTDFSSPLNTHNKNDEYNNLDRYAYSNDQNDDYEQANTYEKYRADFDYDDSYHIESDSEVITNNNYFENL